MDLSVSQKDEIWFLRVCHHISNAVYYVGARKEHITTTAECRGMATSPLQLPAVRVVRISVSPTTATVRIQHNQHLLLCACLFVSQQFPNQQYDTLCWEEMLNTKTGRLRSAVILARHVTFGISRPLVVKRRVSSTKAWQEITARCTQSKYNIH
jgi:hypothetical protein